MQPIAVPPEEVNARPWAAVITFGPPPGVSDEECGTISALVEHFPGRVLPTRIRIPMVVDDEEMLALAENRTVWLTMYANGIVPFGMEVALPPPAEPESASNPLDYIDEAQRAIGRRLA